jgi:shikimate dehydrogenase
LQVDQNEFAAVLAAYQGHGLSVTAPLKELAYQLIPKRTLRAELVQAVNTLMRLPSGEWLSDNTDGLGFIRDVTHNHKQTIENKKILILGAGGAIRGILGPLVDERPASITIVNRNVLKARLLAQVFTTAQLTLTADAWRDVAAYPYDLIIHGTSASHWEEALPAGLCRPDTYCYDLRYDRQSPFLAWAYSQGAKQVTDGLGMLLEQAALAFELWRGVTPETAMLVKHFKP